MVARGAYAFVTPTCILVHANMEEREMRLDQELTAEDMRC